jgi:hypothetical protein
MKPLSEDIYRRIVALKIAVAKESCREGHILKLLTDHNTGEGSQQVLGFLDSFQIHGPNGLHHVLVAEVLAPLANVLRYPIYKKVE